MKKSFRRLIKIGKNEEMKQKVDGDAVRSHGRRDQAGLVPTHDAGRRQTAPFILDAARNFRFNIKIGRL